MMAKTTTKTPAKAAKPVQPEVRENRYLRAARILIETGEGVDLAELAIRANMSEATADHCLAAFVGVSQALRDAKLLPAKAVAKKAPTAPQQPEEAPAPVEPAEAA
jgi:hypothetical protein